MEAAIAAGYRHIDTAYCYSNETDIGKALKSKMQHLPQKVIDLTSTGMGATVS